MLRAFKEKISRSGKSFAQLTLAILLTASVAISTSPRVEAGWCVKSEPAVSQSKFNLNQANPFPYSRYDYRYRQVNRSSWLDKVAFIDSYSQNTVRQQNLYKFNVNEDRYNRPRRADEFQRFLQQYERQQNYQYRELPGHTHGEQPKVVDYDQLPSGFIKQLKDRQNQGCYYGFGHRHR